ncbi:MAG TPA: hypothetical protein VHC69_09290 [Polyangiaceae bacterium]|nr:hypothetical protein [Polyangiaceae bacterium]
MKVFHELAFEGYVVGGATNLFNDPALMELITAVDTIHWSGYTTQVTGVSPTLTLNEFYSNERSLWYNTVAAPILNALPLSTSAETPFQAMDPFPAVARFGYGRLQIVLGPTTARAFLQLWVTGRDLSRRSAPNPATASAAPAATNGYAPPRA